MKTVLTDHHPSLIRIFKDNQNVTDMNACLKKYLGTTKTLYNLKTGIKVQKIKEYLKSQKLTYKDLDDLLLSLSLGRSFEELSAMGVIFSYYPDYRHQINLALVDKLFDHVEGWAETDLTCCFDAPDILDNWSGWQKLLRSFLVDKKIHKRRASIVLLTLPLRHSDDPRLSDTAFEFVQHLKFEKGILITKAISWVLRSLVKYHPDELAVYLENNRDTLPRIAYRETINKLTTGRKN